MVTERSDAPQAVAAPDPVAEPPREPPRGPGGLGGALVKAVRSTPLLAAAGARLTGELAKVAVGRSEVGPGRGDRRFTDPTWADNPAYHRVMQAYLAACAAVGEVVEKADIDDWRDRERARFVATVLTSTLAPTNTLLGNPAALEARVRDRRGSLRPRCPPTSSDLRHNGGLPRQVDRSAFTVGEDVAASPGAVVYRDEVLEVLQYRPVTEQVRRDPVVVVPPQINKYYFMDLAPAARLIEFAVEHKAAGVRDLLAQPHPRARRLGPRHLRRGDPRALDAVAAITGSEQVDLFGLCAGGITTATVLNHLAATGDDRVHRRASG